MVNLGRGTRPDIKLATSRMGERRRRERRSRSELNRAQPRFQVLSPTRRENPGNEVQASDDGGGDHKPANKRKRALRKPWPAKLKWLGLKSLRSKLSITAK